MGRSYRDLVAWKKAMALVAEVYRKTQGFPKDELYGLTSQMRRAAVSIPSNIAEGQGRRSRKEFQQFLGNARGSMIELETQVLIALDLKSLRQADADTLLQASAEAGRILNGLLASLDD